MGMKLIRKTAEHRIYQRRDNRYAVTDADKRPVNGDEKVAILLAAGLVTAPAPQQPEPEAPEAADEEGSAEEAGDGAAAADEAAADEAG